MAWRNPMIFITPEQPHCVQGSCSSGGRQTLWCTQCHTLQVLTRLWPDMKYKSDWHDSNWTEWLKKDMQVKHVGRGRTYPLLLEMYPRDWASRWMQALSLLDNEAGNSITVQELKWSVWVQIIRTKNVFYKMLKEDKINWKQTFLVTVTKPFKWEGQCYLDFFINVNFPEAVWNGTEPSLLALARLLWRCNSTQHDALEQQEVVSIVP